jgi:hypothetical protein
MWRCLLMSNCQSFTLSAVNDGSCPKSVFVSFHCFLFSWFSGTKWLWNTACDVSTAHLLDDRWMDGWMDGSMNVGLWWKGILHRSPSQCHFDNHTALWGLRSVPGQFIGDLWMDKVALGQVFLWILRFPPSVSYHQCSIFIHLSPTPDTLWRHRYIRHLKAHEFWWTTWTSNRTLCAT